MKPHVSKNPFLELPRGKCGRFACVVIGAFFGIVASSLLIELLVHGRIQIAQLWVAELLATFAILGWGPLVWGIAMPGWIDRVIQRASAYMLLVIMVLFLPIAFEFFMLGLRGKL